jgi:hypothetical protein
MATPSDSKRSDDELIAEAVSMARERSAHPNWVTAQTANQCLREVFGQRRQPDDVVARFMNLFCAR